MAHRRDEEGVLSSNQSHHGDGSGPERRPPAAGRRSVLYIPIKDGVPSLEKLSDQDRAVLLAALSPADAAEAFRPVVSALIDTVAALEARLIESRRPDLNGRAREIVTPTPEVRSVLEQSGARVLAKHGAGLVTYSDEITLAVAVVNWQSQILGALNARSHLGQEATGQEHAGAGSGPIARENGDRV